MSHDERSHVERPTLFCLHYLGGSAREWAPLAERLHGAFDVVAIDLPGFGDAARTPGYTVDGMAGVVASKIRSLAPRRWMLVGHSMGAKIAAVLARSAESGALRLTGLVGLVLIAGSPPGPEPIPDADRETMLRWFSGDAESSLAEARRYIANNSGPKLDAISADRAVADVLRANRAAWQAWLASGSREDWSEPVGVLHTPTLVIAGADDENLGPDAQHRLMAPHFAHVREVTFANAKHLLPYECTEDLARSIAEHADLVCDTSEHAVAIGKAYRTLIDSARVSRATREALLERARPDDQRYEPIAMDRAALATLRAVVDRVIPQIGPARIDIGARIDRQLAAGIGDGWRFAALPPDTQAYRIGLHTLNEASKTHYGHDFVALDAALADALLTQIADGESPLLADDAATPRRFGADQMRLWFQDLRADAVKLYVAHPHALERMGYSGIANGGDGMPKSGFVRVGIGEREAWEPVATTERAG